MNRKVIVENNDRVGDFIGVKLDYECDLFEMMENHKVKDFLNKYSSYLFSNNIDKIKEFYHLTGLILTHAYTNGNDNGCYNTVYSMNNIFRNGVSNILNKPIYTTHILVISDYDSNTSSYFKNVYEKEHRDFKIGCDIRYTMSCICNNVKDKIHLIEEKYDKDAFNGIDKKLVKDIILTSLNNLCILLKNGDLYLDKKLYATNVDSIWHQDSWNSFIIYKNNRLEDLTSEFILCCHIKKYKKIVYNDFMLATLKRRRVLLTTVSTIPDVSIFNLFENIDDMKCNKNDLFLKVGDKEIKVVGRATFPVINNKD